MVASDLILCNQRTVVERHSFLTEKKKRKLENESTVWVINRSLSPLPQPAGAKRGLRIL